MSKDDDETQKSTTKTCFLRDSERAGGTDPTTISVNEVEGNPYKTLNDLLVRYVLLVIILSMYIRFVSSMCIHC